MSDGTQIWRLFHNGVDTHPIHVHLFNAQLINRIGQDNLIVAPEPSEYGWKDTFKVNPLEVTFLAMRPVIPTQAQLPFEVQDSNRLIEPGLPEGASLPDPPPAGWFDPEGVGITEVLNHYVNFGWEYVWHCHILAHEEMDMMHSLVGVAAPKAPTGLRWRVGRQGQSLRPPELGRQLLQGGRVQDRTGDERHVHVGSDDDQPSGEHGHVCRTRAWRAITSTGTG